VSHARKTIRGAVVTLVTGLTTTGSRVWSSRVYPSGPDAIPGLIVRTMAEDIAPGGTLGKRVRRVLYLEIEGRVKPAEGESDHDDQMDDICAEVETVVAADPILGGLAQSCALKSTRMSHSGEMERPAGSVVMTWEIVYYTLADAPGTPLYV